MTQQRTKRPPVISSKTGSIEETGKENSGEEKTGSESNETSEESSEQVGYKIQTVWFLIYF